MSLLLRHYQRVKILWPEIKPMDSLIKIFIFIFIKLNTIEFTTIGHIAQKLSVPDLDDQFYDRTCIKFDDVVN